MNLVGFVVLIDMDIGWFLDFIVGDIVGIKGIEYLTELVARFVIGLY